MKNIPKTIFLQVGNDVRAGDDFHDLSEVTWCADKIDDEDIEYVLKKNSSKCQMQTLVIGSLSPYMPCHVNYDENHCCGIFNVLEKGMIICNECGMTITKLIDNLDKKNANYLLFAAKKVVNWYYIFGENSDAAKEHLASLGNAIKEYEIEFGEQDKRTNLEKAIDEIKIVEEGEN